MLRNVPFIYEQTIKEIARHQKSAMQTKQPGTGANSFRKTLTAMVRGLDIGARWDGPRSIANLERTMRGPRHRLGSATASWRL